MADLPVEQPITLDVLTNHEPALSTRSDMPVIETKPDSKAAPEKPAEPEKPEESKAEPEAPEKSATPEEPEDPAANAEPEKKPAKGVQKRIDELVRQREEAERRAEAERAEKLRLLALVEKGSKPTEQPDEDPEPQKPTRDAFASTDEYVAALADYAEQKAAWSSKQAVKDALAEEGRKREQQAIEEGQKAVREAYNSRVSKAVERHADYKDVAESADVTVSIPMAQAILQSEHGPEIQYHLGKNPAEAKRISALHPVQQLVELGLIVAKLTAPSPAPAAPATKPAVSAAPKPINPLESKSEPVKKSPQEMSMDEYAAYVKERDRPGARP